MQNNLKVETLKNISLRENVWLVSRSGVSERKTHIKKPIFVHSALTSTTWELYIRIHTYNQTERMTA